MLATPRQSSQRRRAATSRRDREEMARKAERERLSTLSADA
jgi:hypothetical protein